MPRRVWLVAGAIVLMVNTVQWVVIEAIVASRWSDPAYSYSSNYISDLGVPDCGTKFQGREICSPLHTWMNVSFVAEGLLFALGVVLLASLLSGRTRRVVTALALLHGVGFVLVGLFHGSQGGPASGLVIHVAGAGIGILCANVIATISGTKRGFLLPLGYRRFSIAVGALGLVSIGLVGLSEDTAGIFERGGVYSWLLWGLVTGILLLARELGQTPVEKNVSA